MSEAPPMESSGRPADRASHGNGPPRTGRAGRPGRARRFARWLRGVLPDRLVFNPVFWKDSAITARKKGTFAFRGLYMLLILLVVAIAAVPMAQTLAFAGPAQRMQSGSLLAGMLAQVIQWTQLFALMVAGPIAASGAIAQEKTNRSIDSLYTTPLTRAQIMWGKLGSRLLQIGVLALMPVPILLMLRAFGGIDTIVTLQQTALILTAAALTTSMGLFASIYSKRPWSVIGSTMMILLLVHLIGPVLMYRAFGASMPTPTWLIVGAMCIAPAFPFAGVSIPGLLSGIGMPVPVSMGTVFVVSIAAQLFMVAGITSGAALMLRRIERPRAARRAQAPPLSSEEPATAPGRDPEPAPSAARPGRAARRTERRARRRGSRVVGDRPVFWRELRQPTIDLGRFDWLRWILFPAIGFGIAGLFFVQMPYGDRPYKEAYSYAMLFSVIGFYLLLVSLSRTTSLIPHERSARTWDVLRTTPITPLSIVVQKYIGSMARPTLLGVVLLLAFVPAIMLGVYHWTIIPMLALALAQAMGLLAATGLLLGTMLRKGLTATGANLGVSFGWWLLLPIAVAVICDGFNTVRGSEILLVNPFFQAGVSIAGCQEIAPNELRGRLGVYRDPSPFYWPDRERSLAAHAAVLIGSASAHLALIWGCLFLAARRLHLIRPSA